MRQLKVSFTIWIKKYPPFCIFSKITNESPTYPAPRCQLVSRRTLCCCYQCCTQAQVLFELSLNLSCEQTRNAGTFPSKSRKQMALNCHVCILTILCSFLNLIELSLAKQSVAQSCAHITLAASMYLEIKSKF